MSELIKRLHEGVVDTGHLIKSAASVNATMDEAADALEQQAKQIEDLQAVQAELSAALAEKNEAGLAAKNACMVASSGCSHIKAHAECNEARQFAAATKVNVETALSALHEAIAIQPHASLVAKIKADAMREVVERFVVTPSTQANAILSYADRIEREGK